MSEPTAVRVTRTSRSAGETRRLGERIGRRLGEGDVAALCGELGAGKTQLARGICRGAGVPDGGLADVREKVRCRIDVIGPECAVPLDAPCHNMKLLTAEVRKAVSV